MMDLTIRTYMAIMAERDAAIQERNMSLDERKRAFAERDMAMLQRDAAISERNSAILERDEAITALRLLEDSMNEKTMSLETMNHRNQNHIQQQIHPTMTEARYCPPRENTDYFNFEEVVSEPAKPKARRGKESKRTKSAKSAKVAEGSRQAVDHGWDNDDDASDDEQNKSNRIIFDETIMPTPVCTCTGSPQPCYRWGNGGWQSACCTTAISMYPLPQVSNKRYTRIGGRKMSGSAFSKLLNRIASEGYSLSAPLDLKDHWAKHGTNRYTTAK